MRTPEISAEWTDRERLLAIQYLVLQGMEMLLSNKHFSAQSQFDLLDRIDKITHLDARLLEANKIGLFQDLTRGVA